MKYWAEFGCALIMVTASLTYSCPCLSQTRLDIDPRLMNRWLNQNNGTEVVFHEGEAWVSLANPLGNYSGSGSIEKCIVRGANLCLETRTMQCAFHYSFSDERTLTLEYMDGDDKPCRALQGAYRLKS